MIDEFDRTAEVLKVLGLAMSKIHEEYPGKEYNKIREKLLQPYRDCCKILHYERIRLCQLKNN
jgi:hypothetical protein